MNTPLQQHTQQPQQHGVNPFARALAEARGGQSDQNGGLQPGLGAGFNGALNEAGGDFNPMDQQRQFMEQQKRKQLREQLHRQINPVERRDVYNAKQERVAEEIKNIRHELKLLSQEVSEFNKDIEISIMQNVAAPGTDGSYYFAFFQKLREFIQMLRAKVHSARTWATAVSSKKKKRNSIGLEIGGKQHEQTATVFDKMHHERSNAYAGS